MFIWAEIKCGIPRYRPSKLTPGSWSTRHICQKDRNVTQVKPEKVYQCRKSLSQICEILVHVEDTRVKQMFQSTLRQIHYKMSYVRNQMSGPVHRGEEEV